MLPLWTKFCGVWLLASAAVRGARAVALVPDRARSAAGASVRVRGGPCRRLVLMVPPTEVVPGGAWPDVARTYRRAATVARQGLRAQSLICY